MNTAANIFLKNWIFFFCFTISLVGNAQSKKSKIYIKGIDVSTGGVTLNQNNKIIEKTFKNILKIPI